jgi:uncharacterized repeat protein (TIGR01451 family)
MIAITNDSKAGVAARQVDSSLTGGQGKHVPVAAHRGTEVHTMKRNIKTLTVIFSVVMWAFNFPVISADAQRLDRPAHNSTSYVKTPALMSYKEALTSLSADGALNHIGGNIRQLSGEPELSINVDASPDVVVTGSKVTYTIIVMNEGSSPASAFTVKDDLPPETTFVSCETSGGGLCGGTGNNRVISFESLAPDATATITLVATVNCPVANATEIDNTAEIHLSTPEPDADENDNETVFVTASNPPPSITNVSATPSQLWPPDHKLVNVLVNYRVVDNCGMVVTRLSVASNEPVNGTGDGDTAPDWEVVNARLVRLRAERAGNRNGRIYTITVTASDSAGQMSKQTVQVIVPKSQKK